MPVLTSPDIGNKLKEKWLKANREDPFTGSDSGPLDDSLTSLQWLQNLSVPSADPEGPNGTGPSPALFQQEHHLRQIGSPSSPPAGDTIATGMPLHLGSPVISSNDSSTATRFADYAHTWSGYPQIPIQANPPVEVDYKTNPKIRPPYSYASLICMAMQASQQPKVTLSNIYTWITENFCYYRHAEPRWKNSIRHDLSLNECFKKVPRQKDEPGKGGFWQIDPQYADMFENGIFKRRATSASHYSSSGTRQSKLAEGYPITQNGTGKRKHLPAKGNRKRARVTESALLETEAHINMAHSSLDCNMEVSILGAQHSGLGRWCSGTSSANVVGQNQQGNHHQFYGENMEPSTINMEEFPLLQQRYLNQDQLLQSHPTQQLDEPSTLLPQQPENVVYQPWEETEEDSQAIALALDQSFSVCEGFFTEMQSWECLEAYL